MPTNKVNCKIAGAAGMGVAVMGATLAKSLQRCGLNVITVNDYPSLIKGGHNTMTIRADSEPIYSQTPELDVVLALNKNGTVLHQNELVPGGVVIYDGEQVKLEESEKTRKDIRFISVPMQSLANKAGNPIFLNTVGMGTLFGLIELDLEIFHDLLRKQFARKGEDVVNKNLEAAKAGYDAVEEHLGQPFHVKIQKLPPKKDILINGNEAISVGAIKAGVKFVAEYPMSPSSTILHYMAAHERQYGIVVKHTEDEIAAMNMIIGGAFSGARSMTATSGGGFSLMVEALGMAGINESPIVVVNVQRPGPATGMPTYTEQADLQFMLHASQGEFPRVVIAPGDAEECFRLTFEAFNIAERLQTPVLILSDKYLADNCVTVPRFDAARLRVDRGKLMTDEQMERATGYKRHAITPNGISPRCVPGQKNGIHICSSYEHDETGWTSEDPANRIAQVDKRARKLKALGEGEYAPRLYGDAAAKATIVCWGSTKMPAREALKLLEKQGVKAKVMHLPFLSPFPTKKVEEILGASEKTIVVEGNSTGQLKHLIAENTDVILENTYLRYDGRPFEAADIAEKVKRL